MMMLDVLSKDVSDMFRIRREEMEWPIDTCR